MSKLTVDHVFTSESVSEGHPDKVCDIISDSILDACIKLDPKSRVACETFVSTNFVGNAGEITCSGWDKIDPEKIVRELGLLNPQGWKYRDTAAYGYFGRDLFPWGKVDKADDLRRVIVI